MVSEALSTLYKNRMLSNSLSIKWGRLLKRQDKYLITNNTFNLPYSKLYNLSGH